MKTWKIWAVTIPTMILMVALAVCVWLWNNLKSNWKMETVAAHYVLSHSPIQHLQSHEVFTASSLEDVFRGTDAFHREWYGFYLPQKHVSYSVLQSDLLKPKVIESKLLSQHIQPLKLTVGYIPRDTTSPLKSDHSVVYEVRGKIRSNVTYVYVDATSGNILWKYVL